jgi:hypothetical protein
MTGARADEWALTLLALSASALAWVIMQRQPRLAVGGWVAVTALVPVWWGVSFHFYLMPGPLLAMLVLAALVPLSVGVVGPGDFLVSLVFGLGLLSIAGGQPSQAAIFALLTEALLGFILGRVAVSAVGAEWLYGLIAIVFAVVAGAAIAEFLFSWNPFVHLARSNSQFDAWGQIQVRGGQARAEASFGHSIALGCSLALAVPLTLASRFRVGLKVGLVGVLLVATALTLSRVGIICAVTGLLLSLLFMRTDLVPRARTLIAVVAVSVAVVLLPFVTRTFTAAGSEATGSAQYRGNLLSLIPGMAPSGVSHLATRFADGTVRFGQFKSIDSELILFGLTFGWIPLLALLASLAVACACVVLRRATPATICVVAQIPALTSVALITQYRMLFWFVVGVAAATQAARSRVDTTTANDPFHNEEERHARADRVSTALRGDITPP